MRPKDVCFLIALFSLLFLRLDPCTSKTEVDRNDSHSSTEKDSPVKSLNAEDIPVKDLNADSITKTDGGSGGKGKDGKVEIGGSQEGKKDGEEKHGGGEGKGELKEEPKKKEDSGKGNNDEVSENESVPLKNSQVEECDPANRCDDQKNKFVACLRVPGEDSLSLSLLIQNKGTQALSLNIVAPDFVHLEQKIVQLQAKEHKEMTVSVKDGANDTLIVLKAGDGYCSLDFRNMISSNPKRNEASILPGSISLSTRIPLLCLVFAAALVIGAALLFLRFRRMHQPEGVAGYQKMETALPISTGGKKDADDIDGWDNSWGDGWGDEEAPMTPSRPASTPSSKGLASRKFNKDGWKD